MPADAVISLSEKLAALDLTEEEGALLRRILERAGSDEVSGYGFVPLPLSVYKHDQTDFEFLRVVHRATGWYSIPEVDDEVL